MKVFWWELGLHIEPESSEESKALHLLWNNVRCTSITADEAGSGPKTSEGQTLATSVSNKCLESIVAD